MSNATKAYAEIGTVTEKLNVIEKCGYQPLAHLTLPQYGWQQNYYDLIEAQKQDDMQLYGHVEEARQVVESELELEIKLYEKY